jgi:hypothetical protein
MIPRGQSLIFNVLNRQLDVDISPTEWVMNLPDKSTGDFNTTVRLAPKIYTGKYGNFTLGYNRMDLGNLMDLTFKFISKTNLRSVIGTIMIDPVFYISAKDNVTGELYKYEEKLLPEDILDSNVDLNSGIDYIDIPIQAVPNSYLFTGKTSVRIIR